MARLRVELQTLLEGIMSAYIDDVNQHVWFQAPSSVYLTYPCIIYNLSAKDVLHADDIKYRTMNKYTITVINYDSESSLLADLEELQYCSFDRQFCIDGLYHTIFIIYY